MSLPTQTILWFFGYHHNRNDNTHCSISLIIHCLISTIFIHLFTCERLVVVGKMGEIWCRNSFFYQQKQKGLNFSHTRAFASVAAGVVTNSGDYITLLWCIYSHNGSLTLPEKFKYNQASSPSSLYWVGEVYIYSHEEAVALLLVINKMLFWDANSSCLQS